MSTSPCRADNVITQRNNGQNTEGANEKQDKFNGFTEKHPGDPEILLRRRILYEEVRKQQDILGRNDVPYSKGANKPRRIYKPNSKRVGLTKIRMEDCLRCDACSCIYIDQQDYYKHMTNFHQRYNTIIPRTRRKSPFRYSGSEEFPEIIQTSLGGIKSTQLSNISSTLYPDKNIRDKIKNRWSKVISERLCPLIKVKEEQNLDYSNKQQVVKEEPVEEDMSYLLSQVEVKIKTENTDF